ncbi:uncharacterized protein LOC134826626 isoform X1 [Bolinopsis microptera]|uniref:uncharacterized protein LOC134826626 isoform X1 n=2 Tax=Bolinopsis microptera TaxID=2820187 RepID=UPI00307A2CFC
MNENQFTKIRNASLPAEWFFFLLGIVFLIISIFGNGYVSYRLIKIVRMSKAIQTPIYLSLTICGFCTGVFCLPYMLYTLYFYRIEKLGNLVTVVSVVPTPTPIPHSTTSYSIPANFSWYSSTEQPTIEPDCSDQISVMSSFDRVFCNIAGTVFNITSRLIVWLMLLLSIDRYIFICQPYRIHLVKKQHYAFWIVASSAVITFLSFAPYIFYHPQAVFKKKPPGCPDGYPYQPYKKTYPDSYVCDYSPLIMLNISVHLESAEGFGGMIAFYFFAVVLLNLVPIFLNVAFSVKVLFEILKMRKVTRMTSVTVARGDYTEVTKCEVELEDLTGKCSPPTCPPNLYSQIKRFSVVSQKRKSVLSVMSARVIKKIQGFGRWLTTGSVIENKASFTMLVLSLFYIITYFAWVLVWIAGFLRLYNLEMEYLDKDDMYIYIHLYHSTSSIAYNIMNHYPMATFANAAFVPCLLGYSLHRGKT